MAEKLEGPVTVTQGDGQRESVVSATGLAVGRTVSTRGRTTRLRPTFPGTMTTDGIGTDVATEGTPAAPSASLDVGDKGNAGGIIVRDESDRAVISLNGRSGLISVGTGKGAAGQLMLRSDENGPVILASGKDGRITFMDRRLRQTLVIDAIRGDIELIGADCAEDFEIAELAEPGSVLIVDDDGLLRPCREPYDQRVIGVVSGAGDCQPGLRLDRKPDEHLRQPVAMLGKVNCLADAEPAPISVGNLLTTSAHGGHAMRVTDPSRAFGAVFGKSLGTLSRGRGLLPMLVSLQ